MKQEVYDLTSVDLERVDIVDEPCVPKAKFIIIKNKDKEETLMEDIEKAVPEALSKAIETFMKACEENMDNVDEKMKKRLNLVVGNLKGMVKKSDDNSDDKDTSEQDLLAEMKKELQEEMKDEIEKAGRSISKATEAAIAKVVATLQDAVKSLEALGGKKKEDKKDEYKKPYKDEYPEAKKEKKDEEMATKEEVEASLKKSFDLYKSGGMNEEQLKALIGTLIS